MFSLDLIQKVWQNQYFRNGLFLFVGVTIGVVFYPSKRIEEKVSQRYEQQLKTLTETHAKETQTLNSQIVKMVSTNESLQKESESKITQLTTQVRELSNSRKTSYYKVVHPDGTIEIKQTTDSETSESDSIATKMQEEFKEKLTEATQQLEKTHQEQIATLTKDYTTRSQSYEQTIATLEKSKTIETGVKRFGLEGGYLNDKDYYVHATGDLWGPVFVGVHGEAGPDGSKLGLGLGIRF